VFVLVYEKEFPEDWAPYLPAAERDEASFSIDVAEKSRWLLTPNVYEERVLKWTSRPVPFLRTFIPGVGPIDKAYTVAEIASVVKHAREEKQHFIALRASE
jgi:hypothetical protein